MSDAGAGVAADVAGIPIVSWADHAASLEWAQGEHVAVCAPTGEGKTTLLLSLLDRREWVVLIATKPNDKTLKGLGRRGWQIIRRWPPRRGQQRVILWPPFRKLDSGRAQAATIRAAVDAMFADGSWCIVADDAQYLTDELGLGKMLKTLWLQARAMNISLVASSQRPRWIPVECWSQSSHFYFGKTANGDDLKALGTLAGIDAATVRAVVAVLPPFHFLYVPARRGGTMQVVLAPPP